MASSKTARKKCTYNPALLPIVQAAYAEGERAAASKYPQIDVKPDGTWMTFAAPNKCFASIRLESLAEKYQYIIIGSAISQWCEYRRALPVEAAPATPKEALDMNEGLRLNGKCTDHIWLMEDGAERHVIGVRMDCGDSGTVYLTRERKLLICLSNCMTLRSRYRAAVDPERLRNRGTNERIY